MGFDSKLELSCETRHNNNISAIHTRQLFQFYLFFLPTMSEWNNLDCKIRNSRSVSIL